MQALGSQAYASFAAAPWAGGAISCHAASQVATGGALSGRTAVFHVDLYRIADPSEIDELGLDSAADAVLIVEWPERAGEAEWPQALSLSLEFGRNGDRILTAEVPPSWEGRWPPE